MLSECEAGVDSSQVGDDTTLFRPPFSFEPPGELASGVRKDANRERERFWRPFNVCSSLGVLGRDDGSGLLMSRIVSPLDDEENAPSQEADASRT